jgi:hypothetical protein
VNSAWFNVIQIRDIAEGRHQSFMPLTLIQLISEQTMQNLLPVLRLKPARVVHLATPSTAHRSRHIVDAVALAQGPVEAELQLLSEMPAMAETFGAVKGAIQRCQAAGLTPVVNFTGGTKLMSIGAFSAALNSNHRALSLYVDTADEVFVDGHTAEGLPDLFEGDFSFTPLRSYLTVSVIALAHGRGKVTSGRDWRPLLTLARHLLDAAEEERVTLDALYGAGGFFPRAQGPVSPEDWLKVLDSEFYLPSKVSEMAAKAGLLRISGSGGCLLPEVTRGELTALAEARSQKRFVPEYDSRRVAATAPMQYSVNFLTGSWWEVIVAEAAQASGLFQDVRWSAHAGAGEGGDLEEDILAVDGVQIVCISCKRGGARSKLLSHLEELNARARSLGGQFTRRFLAVRQPLHGAAGRNLRQRGRELGIGILTASDLNHSDTFARRRANP